ncbi:MAG TPA: nucleotide exchange factor GrpE [Thermoleophilaceae bacterium]
MIEERPVTEEETVDESAVRGPQSAGNDPADGGRPTADEPADGGRPTADVAAERDKYLDLAQRTQADFENYRKRAAKDAATAGERAKAGLVRELLPVLDNLERALTTAVHDDGESSPVVEGVRLVRADLLGVLERSGVQAYDPAGEPFDPTVHEALSTRPAPEGTHPGIVMDVVEKGYRLNDTVLRPARVIVSQ